jgi:hypothetical protein
MINAAGYPRVGRNGENLRRDLQMMNVKRLESLENFILYTFL